MKQSEFLYQLHFGLFDGYKDGHSIQVYRLQPGSYCIVKDDVPRHFTNVRFFWLAMQSVFSQFGQLSYTETRIQEDES